MGVKLTTESLKGKLGPGPGGYAVDKKKVQDFSYS